VTAPVLARWDDTRARIEAIRAALPTASTEELHYAVQRLLDNIEDAIATSGDGPAQPAFYVLSGESLCVAYLHGALGLGAVSQ
jgi:hypothetical protein